mmetsp:Transcript_49037/g.87424  ORF Transcript_49037/g.87424 Transcript_49037/m.87424 type:complete len:236 (-) Transcript_49037:2197-2904(-)
MACRRWKARGAEGPVFPTATAVTGNHHPPKRTATHRLKDHRVDPSAPRCASNDERHTAMTCAHPPPPTQRRPTAAVPMPCGSSALPLREEILRIQDFIDIVHTGFGQRLEGNTILQLQRAPEALEQWLAMQCNELLPRDSLHGVHAARMRPEGVVDACKRDPLSVALQGGEVHVGGIDGVNVVGWECRGLFPVIWLGELQNGVHFDAVTRRLPMYVKRLLPDVWLHHRDPERGGP